MSFKTNNPWFRTCNQLHLHVIKTYCCVGAVAHDPKRPSVRRSARLRAKSAFDQDTLISVVLNGTDVYARLDGNSSAFRGRTDSGGEISFEQDYGSGKAKSFIGSGPSAPEHGYIPVKAPEVCS